MVLESVVRISEVCLSPMLLLWIGREDVPRNHAIHLDRFRSNQVRCSRQLWAMAVLKTRLPADLGNKWVNLIHKTARHTATTEGIYQSRTYGNIPPFSTSHRCAIYFFFFVISLHTEWVKHWICPLHSNIHNSLPSRFLSLCPWYAGNVKHWKNEVQITHLLEFLVQDSILHSSYIYFRYINFGFLLLIVKKANFPTDSEIVDHVYGRTGFDLWWLSLFN